jgi:hypothetical protein
MSKSWDKVKQFISGAAPVLGGLVGGPAGAAAGALISSALGVDNDPEIVMQKLQADPDALLKLKQLESDERKHLQEMQLETLRAELADVQSARESHKSHWMPSVITMMLTIMVCAMGALLVMYPIPAENKDMSVYLFGQITGTFTTAVAYWIGTSRSSHEKNKLFGAQ